MNLSRCVRLALKFPYPQRESAHKFMTALPTYPAARSNTHTVKRLKIDLSRPFEEIEAKLRSVPPTDKSIGRNDTLRERNSEVEGVLRSIYEAANGRTVATQIGLVPIAPPAAAFLKDAPFFVETQTDFLLQALARLHTRSGRDGGVRPHEIGTRITDWKAGFRELCSPVRGSISHTLRKARS
jgi:hypothetical protein